MTKERLLHLINVKKVRKKHRKHKGEPEPKVDRISAGIHSAQISLGWNTGSRHSTWSTVQKTIYQNEFWKGQRETKGLRGEKVLQFKIFDVCCNRHGGSDEMF